MSEVARRPVTYRDHLAAKGIQPATIERTVKQPDDVVLHSWCKPAERVGVSRG